MAGWYGDKINSRREFLEELARAQAIVATLTRRLPGELPLRDAARQVVDIEQWTANGRTPTYEERDSVNLAIVLFKEYEMTDDGDILALRSMAPWITYYAKFWPDDRTAADPDNEDYLDL